MIELEDRILLNNGISIVTDELASKMLLNDGEIKPHIKVEESDDSKNYAIKYGEVIHQNIEDFELDSNVWYDQEEFDILFGELYKKRIDDVYIADHQERFIKEIEFFVRNDYQGFLMNLHQMIQNFKRNGIVWGVGRGSSCASYILYLLEVHDVSPIKYNIPFSEFSKERE